MRILVISSFLPYPLFSGGHVRLYNLLKELSGKHKITLICEKRVHQGEKDIMEVKKLCEEVITVERKKQWSPENIVRTSLSSYPFLLVGHTLPEMKKRIVEALKEKSFDLIHVETFYVMQNLPKTYLPVVLAEHNIEYKVYQRFADQAPVFVKPFLSVDIEKIKFWEKKYWRQAKRLIAVSEEEASQMGRDDVVVVPNGVNLDAFGYKKKLSKRKEKRILFMGDFKWIQNTQAATWILKDIWPKIHTEINGTLWIVGKHIPDSLKALGDKSVIFDEHAPDDTAKIYAASDVLLAPIKVGGGTSYKILESMASGVPAVTTDLGVKGLGAKKGKEALVGETEEELAKSVVTLLQDTELYEKIRVAARQLVERKYSWKEIAKVLEGVYEDARKEE